MDEYTNFNRQLWAPKDSVQVVKSVDNVITKFWAQHLALKLASCVLI